MSKLTKHADILYDIVQEYRFAVGGTNTFDDKTLQAFSDEKDFPEYEAFAKLIWQPFFKGTKYDYNNNPSIYQYTFEVLK